MQTSINSHDYDEKKKISLKDFSENDKERLADLSDEELSELKKQAIAEENYDIAKMIKQEQDERKEKKKSQETEDSQELDWQAKREEAWKETSEEIQEEKKASHEENLKKADDLISQLNDGDKSQETEDSQELDWQAKREEAWKEVIKKEETKSSEIKEENENKLNEISDKEFLTAAEIMYEFQNWRWRDNNRMSRGLKYPEEKDIPTMRKRYAEHPEEGVNDKKSFYAYLVNEIYSTVKDSVDDFEKKGIFNQDSETLEKLYDCTTYVKNKISELGMEGTEEFEILEKIDKYIIESNENLKEYLNLPSPSVSIRRHR